MNEEQINQAASGGDFYIWIVMFGILVVGVGYLAWINRNIERQYPILAGTKCINLRNLS